MAPSFVLTFFARADRSKSEPNILARSAELGAHLAPTSKQTSRRDAHQAIIQGRALTCHSANAAMPPSRLHVGVAARWLPVGWPRAQLASGIQLPAG